MSSAVEIFKKYLEYLEYHSEPLYDSLKVPINERRINNLKDSLEVEQLPQDYQQCLEIHNGQVSNTYYELFGSYNFLCDEDVIEKWEANSAIKGFNAKLIPFASLEDDSLYLDLSAPISDSKYGQIVRLNRDTHEPHVIAAGFKEFLERFTNLVYKGLIIPPKDESSRWQFEDDDYAELEWMSYP